MEIIVERLEREFDLDLIATAPTVEYQCTRPDGGDDARRGPLAASPTRASFAGIEEPYVQASYHGAGRVHRRR